MIPDEIITREFNKIDPDELIALTALHYLFCG